jgi:hypothetical protein
LNTKLSLLLLVPLLSVVFISIPVASASVAPATFKMEVICHYGGYNSYASLRFNGVIIVAACTHGEDGQYQIERCLTVVMKSTGSSPYYAQTVVHGSDIQFGKYSPGGTTAQWVGDRNSYGNSWAFWEIDDGSCGGGNT